MEINSSKRQLYTVKTTSILIAMSLSILVIAYNTTALINALPVLQHQFKIKPSNLQWLLNSYILASVALMLLAGKLYDTFDKKTLFLISIAEYIISSALIIFSPNIIFLIAGRTLQGFGAAMLAAGALTIIKVTFIEAKLQKAIARWSTIAGLGFCAGPFIGGFLTSHLSWKYIFWLAILLLIIAAVLVSKFVEHERHLPASAPTAETADKDKIDFPGIVFIVISLLCIVFGLVRVNEAGWNNNINISLFIIGIVSLVIFYFIEKKASNPIVDFSIIKEKTVLFCLIGSLSLFSIILMEIPYLFNFYAQSRLILDFSPYTAGCALLPLNISYLTGSFLASKFVEKFDHFKTIVISLSLQALGLFALVFFAYLASYAYIIIPFIIIGIGAGLSFPCYSLLAIKNTPKEKTGQTSGILNLVTYLGDLTGITIWSLLYYSSGNLFLKENNHFTSMSSGVLNKLIVGDDHAILKTVSSIHKSGIDLFIKKAEIFAFSGSMFFSGMIILLIMIFFVLTFRNKEV